MIKFIIGKPKAKIKQGYYLELNWMSGDADAFEDTKIGPIKEEDFDSLSLLIEWIEKYLDYDHNSKCDKAYKVLDDYKKFVDCYPRDEESNKFIIEWRSDVTCEGYPAALDGYRMFYIDEDGQEFSVRMQKEQA